MPVAEAVVYSFSKLFLSPLASGPLGFVLPSRSSPGDLCIHPAQQAMGREESQPILGGSEPPSSSLYQHARRPYRDTAWGVLYVFSLVLALIGGVYALVHRCVAVGGGATRGCACTQAGWLAAGHTWQQQQRVCIPCEAARSCEAYTPACLLAF